MLAAADIRLNGDQPADIQVADNRLFDRVMSQGSMGLGESYMDGWWEAGRLDDFSSPMAGI